VDAASVEVERGLPDALDVLGLEAAGRGQSLTSAYAVATGESLAQLKIEERVYTDWSLWRLFNIGGAAFFDAGRTYGSNPIGVPQLGWLRDVGVGLRLGNDRSSLGNVIHVDIATPLDGENLSRLQFLVSTEATL